jgi:cytochrome c oxidase subunit 3/cytochrome o ubiquinol oxidase subunit 3
LTIDRNLFGTTYYTLVGFHAFHVTAGLTAIVVAALLGLARPRAKISPLGLELVSWYWHFVDVVWLFVVAVVYVGTR